MGSKRFYRGFEIRPLGTDANVGAGYGTAYCLSDAVIWSHHTCPQISKEPSDSLSLKQPLLLHSSHPSTFMVCRGSLS